MRIAALASGPGTVIRDSTNIAASYPAQALKFSVKAIAFFLVHLSAVTPRIPFDWREDGTESVSGIGSGLAETIPQGLR